MIYKWRNTRRTLAPIFANTYRLLAEDGLRVTREMIDADIRRLFRGNFEQTVDSGLGSAAGFLETHKKTGTT